MILCSFKRWRTKLQRQICLFAGSGSLLLLLLLPITHSLHGAALRRALGPLVIWWSLVISGDPSLRKLDPCAEPKLERRRKDWTNLPPGNSSFPNSSRLLVMRIWRGKTPSPTTPPTPEPKRRGPTLNLNCDKRSKSWLNCSSRGDYNTDPNSPLNLSSTSSADFCQNKVITISTILTKILKMMLSKILNSSPQFSPEPNAC